MKQLRTLDQSYIKRHNIERLLSTLERCQPVSRTELARLTEMSSASVTRFVSALGALGLVKEVSVTDSAGRGRKAVNLCTAPDGMYSLGCHIDPRSLRVCLMDFSRKAKAATEVMLPPEDREPRKLAQLIKEQTARLMPDQPERLRSCGISVSGRMDAEHGIVGASKAFGWSNLNLATPLSEVLGMPVQVENDVRACLTWEATRLGIKDAMKDAAYLYLGRAGIGFGCMVGGQLVRGLNNAAGEIEDVYLNLDETLYEHLMEISMVERARRFSPAVSGIGDILKANRMGLTWARLLIDDFTSHLSIVLQLVRAILDPDCIILGGDMTEALRAVPGLLPDGDYTFGERFEDACAQGAATIALQSALHQRIGVAMEATGDGE